MKFSKFISYFFHPINFPIIGSILYFLLIPEHIYKQQEHLFITIILIGTYIFPLFIVLIMKRFGMINSLRSTPAPCGTSVTMSYMGLASADECARLKYMQMEHWQSYFVHQHEMRHHNASPAELSYFANIRPLLTCRGMDLGSGQSGAAKSDHRSRFRRAEPSFLQAPFLTFRFTCVLRADAFRAAWLWRPPALAAPRLQGLPDFKQRREASRRRCWATANSSADSNSSLLSIQPGTSK